MESTVVTKPNNRSLVLDQERLEAYADRIVKGLALETAPLLKGVRAKIRGNSIKAADITQAFISSALELVSKEDPDWKFAAARAQLTKLYKEAAHNRGYKAYASDPYGSFEGLLNKLVDLGVYREELVTQYSDEEIAELGSLINYEKDMLFDYIGLITLTERYLATDFEYNTMELPQERYMVIAMSLMINENCEYRMNLIKEVYWALQNIYMTTATPTLANAGKKVAGQLSSCFIDTVPDSIEGIYDTDTDVARLSKMGGGIGIYMGKVRSRGSDIRGHKGVAGGVIPWIKNYNNTAVAVDQLGVRSGAIAVYLDVWHKDILGFLDLKLNNGDERMRAHDIFTGVCIPDIFMEAVIARDDWHIFDPHEITKVMGFSLEDCYDEKQGSGTFRDRYAACVANPGLSRVTLPAIDVMKRIMKSQLETGTPYMFYRDTVNRANPNKHSGMIYCSNLCTEILQNMSPTVRVKQEVVTQNGEELIAIWYKPGNYVVCNLSSINLARAVPAGILERLIPIQLRMLDNVIDLNNIEVLQAELTNQKFRGVGAGSFGLHHLLALLGIKWESDEAVQYNDDLYEYINYLLIKASMGLAKEKGAYSLFAGSDWHTGAYFDDRGYTSGERQGKYVTTEQWKQLKADVAKHGIRNANLFAVAPTGSTSIIAGSTASIDPLYELVTYEEKTTYKIVNPAPDLNAKTMWLYKTAFNIDQHWSIKAAAARQRHIDQAQSFNLYVRPEIKAIDFLDLHTSAWEAGIKTTYYVRSKALTIEECESCAS